MSLVRVHEADSQTQFTADNTYSSTVFLGHIQLPTAWKHTYSECYKLLQLYKEGKKKLKSK